MDEFTESLYQSCQRAIQRTNPPGVQKYNHAWHTEGWFVWEIERPFRNKIAPGSFKLTEGVELIVRSPNAPAFYKLKAYTTGIPGSKNNLRTFDFDLRSEEDLVKLNRPLLSLLRERQDPLYKSLANVRISKAIANLHEQVVNAVLSPIEHHQVHTDIDYEESVRKDAFLLGNLLEVGRGFTTVADLEVGMKVRIPRHHNRIAIITAIEPFGTIGKNMSVHYKWEDAPDFVGFHVMNPELSYDWQIIGPPEYHEVHTDLDYEESHKTREVKIPITEVFSGARSKEEKIPVNLPSSLFLKLEWYPVTSTTYDLLIEIDFQGETYNWRKSYDEKKGVWQWLGIHRTQASPEISLEEIFTVERINSNSRQLLNIAIKASMPELESTLQDFLREVGLGPVEHHRVHTDVDYEEALTRDRKALQELTEADVVIPEEVETIDLKSMPEEEVKAAYDQWTKKGASADFGYKPHQYAIFGRIYKAGKGDLVEVDATITLSTNVEISLVFYAYNRMIAASVDAYETPVDPEPIIKALFEQTKLRQLWGYADVDEAINRIVPEMWGEWIGLFKPVEHWKVHTDVDFEESTLISEVRGKPRYRPSRNFTGLSNLRADRTPEEEVHREDYNDVVYELDPWVLKIGNASLSEPIVTFGVKCFAHGKGENPYEDETAVRSLDGPPFYSLTAAFRLTPTRGNPLRMQVRRYFDASGTLCWAKGVGTSSFRNVFCPMADLKAVEARFFGETSPRVDGYFFSLLSGSVADCIGDEDAIRNLWKLFSPFIKELAQRPEVVELEKPFAVVEHHQVHMDVDYEESRRGHARSEAFRESFPGSGVPL